MADVERKRVTLHPMNEDGTIDTSVNLYPKTFIDGIVDRNGNSVSVQRQLTAGANITINSNNVISATGGGGAIYSAGEHIIISKNNVISAVDFQQNLTAPVNGGIILTAGSIYTTFRIDENKINQMINSVVSSAITGAINAKYGWNDK